MFQSKLTFYSLSNKNLLKMFVLENHENKVTKNKKLSLIVNIY